MMNFPNKGKWLLEATINSPQEKAKAIEIRIRLIKELTKLRGKRDNLVMLNKNPQEIKKLDKEIAIKKSQIEQLEKDIMSYKDPKQLGLFDRHKEDIDDDSSSIFGDEPLDEVEDSKTEGYHKESVQITEDSVPSTVKDLEKLMQKYGFKGPKFTGRVVDYGDKEYLYELKVTPEEHQRIVKAGRDDDLRQKLKKMRNDGSLKSKPYTLINIMPSSKQNDIFIVHVKFNK